MRSRVTSNCLPTSSRVWSVFMSMPKRMRRTLASREVRLASMFWVASRRPGGGGGVHRRDDAGVFDEVAEVRVLVVADGRLHGDGLLGDLEHLADLVLGHLHALGEFFRRGLAAHLLDHLPGDAVELVDGLDHVHRDADGARLVGDGAGDGLANPPGGVGRELVAAAVFELVHRLHQADVALLDQVQELQAAVGVLLGDGDHQAQVGLDHLLLGAAGLGLADGHLAVDLLDLADGEDVLALQVLQPALGAAHVALHLGERAE
jgi:hypothetical protein